MYKCIKSQRPGFGLEQNNGIGRDSHPHNKEFPKGTFIVYSSGYLVLDHIMVQNLGHSPRPFRF